jgi:heme oxygenase
VLQLSKVWTEELVKTPLLKADLVDLGAECLEEMPAAQGLVNLIKKSQPIELIGILYVFEGSIMGAAAMYPTICQAYQLSEKGASYFKGYGSQTRSHWSAFKKNFDKVLENDTIAQSIVIASAQATFEQVAALFIALWDNLQH